MDRDDMMETIASIFAVIVLALAGAVGGYKYGRHVERTALTGYFTTMTQLTYHEAYKDGYKDGFVAGKLYVEKQLDLEETDGRY